MEKCGGRWLAIAVLMGIWLGVGVFLNSPAVVATAPVSLGQHCYDISPLTGWCGCIWGAVFYHDRPVASAQVTIDFGGQTIGSITQSDNDVECYPFYHDLHGEDIGLSRLDVFTVTATYNSQTISRTVRAVPNDQREQQVNLIFPAEDPPRWTHYAENTQVRTLVLHDGALWTGGDNGTTRHQQPYGCSTPHGDVGLSNDSIQATISHSDSLWVGTPSGVSEYDGITWTVHPTTGLTSSDIRAITAHPTTGDVYVGAYEHSDGGISRYDGSDWHPLPDINGSGRPNTFQALLVDSTGKLWAGTDSGLSCYSDGITVTYRTEDGLGSNDVYAIAEGGNGDIWLATRFYVSAQGNQGGISRYDVDQGTWDWYTPTVGLGSWDVMDVAVDALGRVWFATLGGGVSRVDEGTIPATWTTFTTADGLPSNNVYSIMVTPDGIVWAGTETGLARFSDYILAPTVMIDEISPIMATKGVHIITFASSAHDENSVLSYDWQSSLDGPLSTASAFTLEASALSVGTHQITFRVQTREGEWSTPDDATLVVEAGRQMYLPLILR